MPSENETNTHSNENKPEIKLVRVLTKSELFFLAFEVFIYGWTGGIFLSLFIVMIAPWVFSAPFVLYLIWFSFPIAFIIALLRRNHLLTSHFDEKRHRYYLEFTYRWRILIPVITFFLMLYYVVYGFHDSRYFTLSIVVFLFMVPIFKILDKPLTEEGEISILFEMLSHPIDNFHEALRYWKKLAKKIEQMFKAGNIQLSRKDLVYNFSKTLLEKNEDISNDLTSIRNWMLGRARTCLEGLRHIYPKIRLLPSEKNVFLDWLLKNPEATLNWFFKGILIAAAVTLTVIGLNPKLIGDILTYLNL